VPRYLLEGTEENHKNRNQNSRSRGRGLNLTAPEREAGMPPTQLRLSALDRSVMVGYIEVCAIDLGKSEIMDSVSVHGC
jgi:hypothetical protein